MDRELVEYIRYMVFATAGKDLGEGLSESPVGTFSNELNLLENCLFPAGAKGNEPELAMFRAPETSEATRRKRLKAVEKTKLAKIATALCENSANLGLASKKGLACGYKVIDPDKFFGVLAHDAFEVVYDALIKFRLLRRNWIRPQHCFRIGVGPQLLEKALAASNGKVVQSAEGHKEKLRSIVRWLQIDWRETLSDIGLNRHAGDNPNSPMSILTYWWRLAYVLHRGIHDVFLGLSENETLPENEGMWIPASGGMPIGPVPKNVVRVLKKVVERAVIVGFNDSKVELLRTQPQWIGPDEFLQLLISELAKDRDAQLMGMEERSQLLIRELAKHQDTQLKSMEGRSQSLIREFAKHEDIQLKGLEERSQFLIRELANQHDTQLKDLDQRLQEIDRRTVETFQHLVDAERQRAGQLPPSPPKATSVPITPRLLKSVLGRSDASRNLEIVGISASLKADQWARLLTLSEVQALAKKNHLSMAGTKRDIINRLRALLKDRMRQLHV